MPVFEQKIWRDRQAEHRGRRKLVPTGTEQVFDVERAEGLVIEEGDAFDAATMNDLERRIAAGMDGVLGLYSATLTLENWRPVDDSDLNSGYTQAAPLTSVQTGEAAAAGVRLCSGPMCRKTEDPATNATLLKALALVNAGWETLENGVITLHLSKKPACDLAVVWQAAGAEALGEAAASDVRTLTAAEIDSILTQ